MQTETMIDLRYAHSPITYLIGRHRHDNRYLASKLLKLADVLRKVFYIEEGDAARAERSAGRLGRLAGDQIPSI